MPKEFEQKVKAQGGAKRWRNVKIPGHKGEYLKVAITNKTGPKGGHTVAYKKLKQTEDRAARIVASMLENS